MKPVRQSSPPATLTPLTAPVSTPTGNLATPQPAPTPNADALPNAKEVALVNATFSNGECLLGSVGSLLTP